MVSLTSEGIYVVPTTTNPLHFKDLVRLREQAGWGAACVKTSWLEAIHQGIRIQYLFYLGPGSGIHVVEEAPADSALLGMCAADAEDVYVTKNTELASREQGIVSITSLVVNKVFKQRGYASVIVKWMQEEVIRLSARRGDRGQPAWKEGWKAQVLTVSIMLPNPSSVALFTNLGYKEYQRIHNYFANHHPGQELPEHWCIFLKKDVTSEERARVLNM